MESQTLQLIDEMNRVLAEASAMGMAVDNARSRADRLEQIAARIERVETQADHGATLENSGDIRVVSDRLRHIAKRLEIVRSVAIVKANETLYLLNSAQPYQQQETSARVHFSESVYLSEALRVLTG